MSEIALAPVDIEVAVVAVLGANAATRVPNPFPAGPVIRVQRIGGQARNLIQSVPRVLVECWDDDETSAFDLARMSYARLWACADSYMTEDVYVTQIELTEPVNFPDPDTKKPRFQFIAALTTSLAEITLDLGS